MTDKKNSMAYFYCICHDDAFYIVIDPVQNVYKLNWNSKCCLKKSSCELMYIGTRTYDRTNVLITDTTPSDQYFSRKGGSYSRKYLDEATMIVLDK